MSEYKFVQWGKGVPVDYQRLGQMVSNEEYLKNKIDPSPKGIILWKSISSFTLDPTGGQDVITGLNNLAFDVDEDRLISFTFLPGTIAGASPVALTDVQFHILIDGTNYKNAGGYYTYDGRGPGPTLGYIHPSALSKGSHSVSIVLVGNGSLTTITVGSNNSNPLLIVRDEGQFISPSS